MLTDVQTPFLGTPLVPLRVDVNRSGEAGDKVPLRRLPGRQLLDALGGGAEPSGPLLAHDTYIYIYIYIYIYSTYSIHIYTYVMIIVIMYPLLARAAAASRHARVGGECVQVVVYM